jgi:hypothetical protein
MKPRNHRSVALLVLVSAVLVAVAAIVVSHSDDAQSGVAVAEPLGPREEATIRKSRRGLRSEPAAGAAITAHAKTTVAGEAWKIVSYRAKSGKLCVGTAWPSVGHAISCGTREEWFARGPVSVWIDKRQAPDEVPTWETFVVGGFADVRRVQSIELVSTDCSTREILLDPSGYFLDVIGSEVIAQGVWPYEIVAHGANGQIVQRITVRPRPPDTEAARAAGVKAPSVGADCA